MKNTIILETMPGPEKPFTCELCGKTDDEVEIYLGGLFMYLHESCAELADKAIDRYLQSLVTRQWSLIQFAEEIMDVSKKVLKETEQ